MPPATKRPVAERITTTLTNDIVEGRLQPGDALPSERELATAYDVNRSSVREAMKQLEAWGLVKIRHGGATRVGSLFDAGLHLVPRLVEAGGEAGQAVLRDLHELRGLLLGWGAERAAERARPVDLATLEAIVAAVESPAARPEELQVLDYDFFHALMAQSGNQLLTLASRVVREVYFKRSEHFLAMYGPGIFDAAHHRRAMTAIAARDGRAAGDAMRAHASSALRRLEERR